MKRVVVLTLPLIIACCGIGCGSSNAPELGSVHGVVTLDGKPLEGATVEFYPTRGRPSIATTDEDGEYNLKYTLEEMGATLGQHTVRISTFEEYLDDNENDAQKPERVPTKYNAKSELKREVKAGDNPFNFELTSDGEILQPGELERAIEAEEAYGNQGSGDENGSID